MEPNQSAIKRKIAEKLFIGLLCAVALVLPFHKVLPSPLLTLAAIIGIFSGNFPQKWKRLKSNRSILIFASLYLIALAGYLLSDNKPIAARDLQVKISIALIPVILGAYIDLTKREVMLIIRCFVISCFIFAVAALNKAAFDYFTTGVNHFFYTDLVEFTFIHPSYIAMFEVFAVIVLLFNLLKVWKQSSFKFKLLHISSILFLIFFIFLLSSKMAILSLFVLVSMILYISLAPVVGRFKTILILFAILITGLIVILSLPKTRERFLMLFSYNQVDYANSTDSREEIWKSGFQISGEHFFTGVGSGDAEQVLVDHYQANKFSKGVEERYNAHNQYLQIMIETGVFGLVLFLIVIIYSIRCALKYRDYLYFTFLLLFLINIFTESMLKTQSGVVFYAFFNSLLGLYFSRSTAVLTNS